MKIYTRMEVLVELIAKDADYPDTPWLYCKCSYEDTGESRKRWVLVTDLRVEGGLAALNEIIDDLPLKTYERQ